LLSANKLTEKTCLGPAENGSKQMPVNQTDVKEVQTLTATHQTSQQGLATQLAHHHQHIKYPDNRKQLKTQTARHNYTQDKSLLNPVQASN
jgi:hypothetical protein